MSFDTTINFEGTTPRRSSGFTINLHDPFKGAFVVVIKSYNVSILIKCTPANPTVVNFHVLRRFEDWFQNCSLKVALLPLAISENMSHPFSLRAGHLGYKIL